MLKFRTNNLSSIKLDFPFYCTLEAFCHTKWNGSFILVSTLYEHSKHVSFMQALHLRYRFCVSTSWWLMLAETQSPPHIQLHSGLKTAWNRLDGEERTYGGCEEPDPMYVKLISDGHVFIVKREHALTGTIKAVC